MGPADRIESILAAAVDIAGEAERRQFVERACGGDAKLRRRVEELVTDHFRAGSFLDSPAPAVRDLMAAAAGGEQTVQQRGADDRAAERPGAKVGRYKLLERIGEGGMGVVFMAQQQEPVRRKVALKVIKVGMDTRQVVARFEAERQALALMDHPNIARVLDGGSTDGGRPYFVMELVQGVPITDFCDQNRFTARQRLELFVPVCQAVQHAHTKGVIHRDLKPSNVLVTLADGVPVPKVIDFGIAKAAGQELTDKTLFTQFAQLVGTPLYMSPEQAGGGADVDTRSDVFSLGVLLYELLTGTTPFDKGRLGRAAYDEMRRIIREEEPPRPSTRISTLGAALASVSAQRKIDPRRLGPLVRGELDWIVMRAMEKDRAGRYETASGLARDVERYLADEAVQACPPSARYRLRKFARRNKGPVLAAAVVLLALLVGVAGTTWQAVRATTERNRKQAALDAQSAALKAEAAARGQAMDALRTLLEQVSAERAPTEQDREFMRKILTHYEAFAAVTGDTAEGRAIRAEGYLGVGRLHLHLGDVDEARASLETAVGLLAALVNDYPAERLYRGLLATAHSHLGELATRSSKPADAVAPWRKALELQTRLAADTADTPEHRYKLGALHYALASAIRQLGKPAEALDELRVAIEIQEKLVIDFPGSSRSRQAHAVSLTGLGEALVETKQPEEGEVAGRKAVAICERLVREFPAATDYRYQHGEAHRSLGGTLQKLGDAPGAVAEYRVAVADFKTLAAKLPGDPIHRLEWGNTHISLGLALTELGEDAAARDEYRHALEILEGLAADFPNDPVYPVSLGGCYCNLARLSLGTLEEKLAAYQEAIAKLAPVVRREPGLLQAREFLSNTYWGRASTLAYAGRFAESIADCDRAIELADGPKREILQRQRSGCVDLQRQVEARRKLIETVGAADSKTLAAGKALTRAYEEADCFSLAVPLLEEDLAAVSRARAPDHPDRFDVMNRLGVVAFKLGRFKQAIRLFEGALPPLEARRGKEDRLTIQTLANLGVNYRDDGQVGRAIPLLEEALRRQRTRQDPPMKLDFVVTALAKAYEAEGSYAKAEPLRRESVRLTEEGREPVYHALDRLAFNLLQQKQHPAAEEVLNESLAMGERSEAEQWTTFAAKSMLGEALMGQGRHDDAEPLLLDGYKAMRLRREQIPPQVRAARLIQGLERLVRFYEGRNADKANEWRAELEARRAALSKSGGASGE